MKEAIGIAILCLLIWVLTAEPEQIGSFAGKVVHSFEQAKQ